MKINASAIERILENGSESAVTSVMSAMEHMINYTSHIYMVPQELALSKLKAFDLEDYQHDYKRLDRIRSEYHDKAIAGIGDMARIGAEMSITDVLDTNGRDYADIHRTEIGNAIFEFCAEWVERHK